MPVLTPAHAPTHAHGATRFTSLATPSRGGTSDTAVWRVDIAAGTPATPHRLTREEVFVVLSGGAAVRIGGERRMVVSGDVIVVPPDTDFELATDDQALSALCCLPVGGQAYTSGGAPFTPPWAQ